MDESAVYNESDLAPFHRRLAELRNIVQSDSQTGKHPSALTKLLERQLNECGLLRLPIAYRQLTLFFFGLDAIVRSLEESLSVLSVELIPIHEKLVTIRRQLVALAAKEGSHKAELKPLQEELRKIDSLSICSPVCRCFGLGILVEHSYLFPLANESMGNFLARVASSPHLKLSALRFSRSASRFHKKSKPTKNPKMSRLPSNPYTTDSAKFGQSWRT